MPGSPWKADRVTYLARERLPDPSWPAPVARRQHPHATAAFVVGIVSLVGVVMVVPAALGPLACYLGASARRDIEREPHRWDGGSQATAGLVLGIIATAVFTLITVLMLVSAGLFALAVNMDTGY
jgi:hypothetical protein